MQYIDGTAKVVKSNPSDPSQFEKDSRLKPAFWAMAYTPKNVLEEYGCGATLANVTEDIQLLSQLTTRLRTYSTSCNQTQLTLQAIEDTKVNMTVWIGAYVGDNSTVNEQQQQDVLDALTLYGTEHVSGITIGNECVLPFLLLLVTRPPRSSLSSLSKPLCVPSVSSLPSLALAALNLDKSLPVGTSDAGSSFNAALTEGSDYIMANVHPWFGGLAIDQAAGWTWDFFEQNDVVLAEAASNKPTAYIAETGWPTQSMTPENATLGAAVAGVGELQTFLDTYPCQANANQSYYFYFEPFDEPWKERFGGVEPYWGLFDSNKVLKDITFPDCPIDSTHASG
ncbi:glycoside hydrolase family 17 protein [Rhodotorula graminis WP1]|uniref:glucan endo-1,3-beta-D-glucosidase n=1 Tax=Rhodotorula graminis (strain WP1) TaxID=578459 RepID=A0A194S188_RHOGW|nr:glycoside hydrolase family 17 protein [Rhodotorula graminis WP1]KPV74362.1 glycoside hydrolase family 17 protein [Rhodotorula graminis WP1]